MSQISIDINRKFQFYNDYLYKKLKTKSEILENLLENTELTLPNEHQINSLFNLSLPSQEDVWICGRVYSDNAGGGGKLTPHNVYLQGSYMCSNCHNIPLDLSQCDEYSLFPGQLIIACGRNPDGKKFICKKILEPGYPQIKAKNAIPSDMSLLIACGPYMKQGSLDYDSINQLIHVAKQNQTQIIILLGPLVDANHDLLANTNTQLTYDQHLQSFLNSLSQLLHGTNMHVIIQPSIHDLTQEPVYPVLPFSPLSQFIKQNQNFHFTSEPSMININGLQIGITSTDIIKDLTTSSVSKTQSTDKISRNISHLLRQKSFYPINPPNDNICIDFEAWHDHAKLDATPNLLIISSDLATFNKEINGCVCVNPGRAVRGTSMGTYALIDVKAKSDGDKENKCISSCISVSLQKL